MHALDLVNTVATAGVVLFARRLVGFMLGTTVNAVANMSALVERFGPALKAFLAVIITFCLNLWS